MAQYILLLHESTQNPDDFDGAEAARVVEEYNQWAAKLAAQGKLVGAEKLRDDGGRVLKPGPEVHQGPYHGPEDVVGGYFIIEAAGYDEALELAGDCPHLAYGGQIEVREIEPT